MKTHKKEKKELLNTAVAKEVKQKDLYREKRVPWLIYF